MMYKPSKYSVDEVLINNLEKNEFINTKLIEYYLDLNDLKLALYYFQKINKRENEFSFIINSELFLKLKKEKNAVKLLKIALFDYNSESAFFILQNLYFKGNKSIPDFPKVVKKGMELNPYLINYYYSVLLKSKDINKKELFEQYISYSDDLRISENEFLAIELNKTEKLYYLEKIILKNKYKWAKKLYKEILFENPYLINLRRVLILN